jgi:predicted GNAT family N-acyltransferase
LTQEGRPAPGRGRGAWRVAIVPWRARKAVLAGIRHRVFVAEQGVPPGLELDRRDRRARHALALGPGGRPVGCGRLLADGHIGRLAVLPPWRGRGVGTALLRALEGAARRRGLARVFLHAQVAALGFYARHGYTAAGPEFLDAGIPHRYMYKHVHARPRGRPRPRPQEPGG